MVAGVPLQALGFRQGSGRAGYSATWAIKPTAGIGDGMGSQRLYWARLRTTSRNRIHALLDRQRSLALPSMLGHLRRTRAALSAPARVSRARWHRCCRKQLGPARFDRRSRCERKRSGSRVEFEREPIYERLGACPVSDRRSGRCWRARDRPDRALPQRGQALRLRRRGPEDLQLRRQGCITAGCCSRVTNGCAGRYSKPAGRRSAARPASEIRWFSNAANG